MDDLIKRMRQMKAKKGNLTKGILSESLEVTGLILMLAVFVDIYIMLAF